MTAATDISATDAKFAGKTVGMTAENGTVDLTTDESSAEVEAETLSITAGEDVRLSGRNMTVADAVVIEAGNAVMADGAVLSGNSIEMTAQSDRIDVRDAELTATEELNLTAATDIAATDSKLAGKTVGMTAQSGAVVADNAQITAQERLAVSAATDVSMVNAALSTTDAAVTLMARTGTVDLSTDESTSAVESETLSITAGEDVRLSGRNVTVADAVVVEAGNAVMADGIVLSGDSIAMKAIDGNIALAQAQLKIKNDLALQAGTQLNLTDAEVTSSDSSNIVFETQSDSIIMTGMDSLLGRDIQIKSGADVIFNDAQTVTVTQGDLTVSAAGAINARGLVANVAGSLTLAAEGDNVLSQARLNNGGALTLKAGTAREGSKLNVLDLTGVINNNLASGEFKASSVTLETSGQLLTGDVVLNVQAFNGDAIVKADRIDLRTDSVISASGGDAVIDAVTSLKAGDNLRLDGNSVLVTGGLEAFEIGKNSHFNAKDGKVSVIGDADVTLGGQIHASAKKQESTDAEAGSIKIGAQGVLSVTDDEVTITAADGRVTVYGGAGMTIHNNLTVISAETATLQTDWGNLTVGNSATIKAGTQSGLQSGRYGDIIVSAGEHFEIGESATMLADNLLVTANEDIRFGNNATLVGATDGVQIWSESGSIYMGENLTVRSASDKTSFIAGENIVIDRKGTLTSRDNEIEFIAQNDIVFGDDFTVEGEGFVLKADQDVRVGADAHIKTVHSQQSGALFTTDISAGGGIEFGDRAQFDTTDLVLWAQSGDVVFGDDSRTQTSVLGIMVTAGGNVTYGRNATFGTTADNLDGDIHIQAGWGRDTGSVTLNEGAEITAAGNVYLLAQENIEIGKGSRVVGNINDASTVVAISSSQGDIHFGEDALIGGYVVSLRAGDEDLEGGGSVVLADRASVVVNDTFEAAATKDVIMQGDFLLIDGSLGDGGVGASSFKAATGDVCFADNAVFMTTGLIKVEAGNDILVGKNAYLQSEAMDDNLGYEHPDGITMTAQGNVSFAENAKLLTDETIEISGREGVHFAGGTEIGAEKENSHDNGFVRVISELGNVDFVGDAHVYGDQLFEIDAGKSVNITGDSWLDSDGKIDIRARAGDIVMTSAVRLGGVDESNRATHEMSLVASGSIVQQDIVDGMGVTAQKLTVRAGGDVLLGAVDTGAGLSGNSIENADIQSGGSIHLGLSYTPSTVTINAETGGVVNGSLIVHGMSSDVTLSNDISASGDVALFGKSLVLGDVTAGKSLIASTAIYDETAADGIRGGKLSASEIGLMTGQGAIAVKGLEARKSRVDVYRTGLDVEASVVIDEGYAQGAATVFNANGAIKTDFKAGDLFYVFTGLNAETIGSHFISGVDRVAVIANAQNLSHYLSDSFVFGHHASDIDFSVFPRFDFSQFAVTVLKDASMTLRQTEELFEQYAETISEVPVEVDSLVTDDWTQEVLKDSWYIGKSVGQTTKDLSL